MEPTRVVKTDMATLSPLMLECLAGGTDVVIPITGTSMLPLLRAGIDRVQLTAPPEKLKKGDIPLYRRQNGQFVLHRVVKVTEKGYTMVGDNQTLLEPGIGHSQVLAVTKGIYRKGRYRSCRHVGYRMSAWCWRVILPIRRPFLWIYHLGRRVLKKLGR